ncbi:GAF domain-containing sensor histidine kinase [Halorubrum yunnanense]|uniref:histidine kinase n=1 Tax=Halorubrum yunnanense TaxID=1526162 RepID=A0ABD5YDT0_9EURY|nr:GAF domain-containing sensor histidine kinase [Halorubrum yunnanense]
MYLRDITGQRELEQRRQESLHAIQQLYAVSSDQGRSFEEKVEAILELSCEYLSMPNGLLTRIEAGTQYVEISHADHPELQAGQSCPLEQAYCKRTVDLDSLLTIVNAADEGWDDDPAHEQSGIESYVGGRIEVAGERYGTLCFADVDPRADGFTDTQRTFVELLTRWVSYELERQRAQSQLQRERDRLDRFASVVSHDLRNPLNTAMGRVDLLAADCDSEHVPPIERSLDRIEALIEDLLVMAREGLPVDELEVVDLDDVASDAWSTAETGESGLRATSGGLRIMADRTRLRQLLENLFRNSAEHGSASSGSPDGEGIDGDGVAVTVGALTDRSGFYVADDGPGVPTADREQVFEMGYTTTSGGTGFGLSIVEEIAGAHGWEVSLVESADGGARFEFAGVEPA